MLLYAISPKRIIFDITDMIQKSKMTFYERNPHPTIQVNETWADQEGNMDPLPSTLENHKWLAIDFRRNSCMDTYREAILPSGPIASQRRSIL